MVGVVIVFGAAAVSLANTELAIYAAIVAFFANLGKRDNQGLRGYGFR